MAIMLDAEPGLGSTDRLARHPAAASLTTSSGSEDPMPWYDERHALRRLKAEVNVPIAAGETEFTPFGLRTMVAEGLVDYLIIDSTWAGGLTVWRKAAVMAELYQVPLAAAPRSTDPRPRGGGEPDRLHPRIVRRHHTRSAVVRAVP